MAFDFSFSDFYDEDDQSEENIEFHFEDVDFDLDNEARLREWIRAVVESEKADIEQLTFIFCSDNYLHELNLSYLDHDTYTDVITFPYAEPPLVHGDVFLSIERVRENAQSFNVTFEEELYRVMIHGVLHLCGYGDKSPEEIQLIRQKEDTALELLQQLSK